MAELLKFNVPITSFTVDFRGNLTAKINKRNEVRKSMISTLDSSKTNTKLKRCNSFEPKIRSKSHMVEAPNPLPTDL